MGGWTVPTTVFRLAALVLSLSLLVLYYAARLVAWWSEQTATLPCRCPQCATTRGEVNR